jgi:hypothetical protein
MLQERWQFVAYFKVLTWNLPTETEENHKKSQMG